MRAIVSGHWPSARTTLLRVAALSFMFAALLAAQRPPSRFQLAACTMECCGYGAWRATSSRGAFAAPDSVSARAFTVQPNDSVVAGDGVVAMQTMGVLRAEGARRLRVRQYPDGRAWQTIDVAADDTLYVLFEDAEATDAVIWRRGSSYSSAADFDGFTTLTRLRSVWWARIRNGNGRTGWIADPASAFAGPGECGPPTAVDPSKSLNAETSRPARE